MIKLNETPVRTVRNFNINNLKLDNAEVLQKVEKFKNVKVAVESEKICVDDNVSDVKLTYGLGDFFTEQVQKSANQKLHINIDCKTEKKVEVDFYLNAEQSQLIENIEIVANENTKATVVLKYAAEKSVEAYHNGILRIHAKKDADVKMIFVNLLNVNSKHFMAIESKLEENSKVTYTSIEFGGKYSVTNYYANLLGSPSENKINTIYLGKENQMFDLNYIGELRGQKSVINMEVQGALKDNAKKHFKGTIDFKKGCKKAKGDENESCMLLSDTAKSIALPMLLCAEEEVEGNHSSSAGKVNESELFYLMSRGFSLKEALQLMVRAKFNTVLQNIKDENLREEIIEEIEERLE